MTQIKGLEHLMHRHTSDLKQLFKGMNVFVWTIENLDTSQYMVQDYLKLKHHELRRVFDMKHNEFNACYKLVKDMKDFSIHFQLINLSNQYLRYYDK